MYLFNFNVKKGLRTPIKELSTLKAQSLESSYLLNRINAIYLI
jgi:hypothetical protein